MNSALYSPTYRQVVFPLLALLAIQISTGVAQEKKLDASKLLPEDTVLFVQTKDVREMHAAFMETQSGKFMQDEELAPLLGGLYNEANEAYDKNLKDRVGVELGDLHQLAQGEIAFAVAAPKNGAPVAILFVEIGEENEVAQTLMEKGREFAREEGNAETTEDFGETKLKFLGDVCYFEREGMLCFCGSDNRDDSREIIESIVNRWDGNVDKRARTLSDNRKFVNIMARCRGTKDERPQLRFFVDPIEFYRKATRGNTAATIALGIIRNLGLDGLSAIGGSTISATEDFDSLIHLHVLLSNPRAGVIEMFAMKSDDVTPEPWVPHNIASYMTTNWDVEKTYVELEKIYETFYTEEGSFAAAVEKNLSTNLGVGFKEDLLDVLDGRVTFTTMYVKPTFNGVANVISFGVNDPEKMRETLDAILEKTDQRSVWEEKKLAGHKYFRMPSPDIEGQQERRFQRRVERAKEEGREPPVARVRMDFRTPEPCLGIIDDYVILTDSEDFMRKAIETLDDEDQSLATDPDFLKTMKQIRKHLQGKKPGMITYNRPEEGLRMMYDLATSDNVRDVLKDRSEQIDFAGRLGKILSDNELPDFDHFLQYIAPVGGVLVNDESGLHYMAFALKAK